MNALSRRLAVLALGAAAASACLAPLPLTPEGFACRVDADCEDVSRYACVEERCVPREAVTFEVTPFPVRAAFVKGGYPHTWPEGDTQQQPRQGRYSSNDPLIQAGQIEALAHGNFQAGFFHWYGATTATDRVFVQLLSHQTHGVKWAVVVEEELTRTPSSRDVQLMLADIHNRFGASENYLRVEGGLVVVVPTNYHAGCEAADRWVTGSEASQTRTFLLMMVASQMPEEGLGCERQPSAWYRVAESLPWVATEDAVTVMPGAWRHDGAEPRLARDLGRFEQDLARLASSDTRFHLVRSLNDWPDGTQIEPSDQEVQGFGPWLEALHTVP